MDGVFSFFWQPADRFTYHLPGDVGFGRRRRLLKQIGVSTDAASMGNAFIPLPAELARFLWEFDARTSGPNGEPDFPASPDFDLAN